MSPAAPRRYLVNFPRLGAGRNSRAGHRQAIAKASPCTSSMDWRTSAPLERWRTDKEITQNLSVDRAVP